MAAGAALPGLLFVSAATVLLIIVSSFPLSLFYLTPAHPFQVSISSPTWEKVSFLDVIDGRSETHFGVFGYTGSKATIGYTFAPDKLGFDDTKLNTGILHHLTFVLILWPIGKRLTPHNHPSY